MRTRRKGIWLPRQPRLGARMCQGTFFFIHDNRILAGVHSIVAVEERKESKWIRIL